MTLRRLILPSLLLCIPAAVPAQAQLLHPSSPMPSFSVVSIRPSNPNGLNPQHNTTTADTYHAERTTVRDLLAFAFALGYQDELLNPPSWVTHNPYDIETKLDPEQMAALDKLDRNDRDQQLRLMMQSMLADRFHLTYHFETRRLPVYTLTLAKNASKTGLKCPPDPDASPAIANTDRPRFRWYTAPAPPPPPVDLPLTSQPTLHLRTRGWPFWLIVSWISHQPELDGRPVIDQTNLHGPYDCQMTWSHDGSVENAESFFPALQNQIGLKLQPTKLPIEVLVIDSIQHPSDN